MSRPSRPRQCALATLIVAMLLLGEVAAQPVGLDAAGALQRLEAERPEHFAQVVRILDDAQRLPEKSVIGWLRTTHRADDAAFGPTLLTSFPPQRRLSFSLDAVPYRATVTVSTSPATAIPAR